MATKRDIGLPRKIRICITYLVLAALLETLASLDSFGLTVFASPRECSTASKAGETTSRSYPHRGHMSSGASASPRVKTGRDDLKGRLLNQLAPSGRSKFKEPCRTLGFGRQLLNEFITRNHKQCEPTSAKLIRSNRILS